MKKYTIIELDVLDNDYKNSPYYDNYNKLCIESQKKLIDYNNDDIRFEWKLIDKNSQITKKAFANCDESIFNEILLSSGDEHNKNAKLADIVKYYILSEYEDILMLDDDVLVTNHKEFINGLLSNTSNIIVKGEYEICNNKIKEPFKKIYNSLTQNLNLEHANFEYEMFPKKFNSLKHMAIFDKKNIHEKLMPPIKISSYDEFSLLKKSNVILTNNFYLLNKIKTKNKLFLNYTKLDEFNKYLFEKYFGLKI